VRLTERGGYPWRSGRALVTVHRLCSAARSARGASPADSVLPLAACPLVRSTALLLSCRADPSVPTSRLDRPGGQQVKRPLVSSEPCIVSSMNCICAGHYDNAVGRVGLHTDVVSLLSFGHIPYCPGVLSRLCVNRGEGIDDDHQPYTVRLASSTPCGGLPQESCRSATSSIRYVRNDRPQDAKSAAPPSLPLPLETCAKEALQGQEVVTFSHFSRSCVQPWAQDPLVISEGGRERGALKGPRTTDRPNPLEGALEGRPIIEKIYRASLDAL